MIELIGNEYIPEKTAVALGFFDGLHHGHRKVIAEILDKSAPTVFTFRTESIQYKHGKPLEYIYTNEQKLKILEKMGVKYVYSPDFDAVKDMDGEEFAKEILAAKGVALKVVEFTDYVQPNNVVDSGEIDANYFQHLPYLEDFNAQNGTKVVSVAAVHVEPMGLYGGKQTTLDALK